MKHVEQQSPVPHYAALASTLAGYFVLGPVIASGWSSGAELLDGPAALDRAVCDGARWISWAGGAQVPGCLRVTAGTGADIATAATVALAIIEELENTGALVVPAVENATSLLLYLGSTDHRLGSAATLAARAPEIATVDPEASDGRALLIELAPGSPIPLPYSLVDGAEGTTAVMPVTVDEIAAMTAGMPVDPSPEVVLERVRTEGDLAVGLLLGARPGNASEDDSA